MATRDLYKILGLSPGARPEEIRQKYKKLARQLHPDINPSPGAEERFKELALAFSTLTDPRRKALYDEFGDASLRLGFSASEARRRRPARGARRPHPGGEHQPPPAASPAARPRRGHEADLVQPLDIDLGLAIRGGEVPVPSPGGGPPIPLSIPAGVDDGVRLCLPGRGLSSRGGGRPGDLYVELRVRPNPHYWREGLDLHLELPITLSEAARGATVEVPAPGGKLRLTVPPECHGGERMRLGGKGLRGADGLRAGDLVVHLSVRLPVGTAKARRALDQLCALYRGPVRGDVKL